MSSEEESAIALVDRFFRSFERGDFETIGELYGPRAVVWHNDGRGDQSRGENIAVLRWLHEKIADLRIEVRRRSFVDGGVFQFHVLRGHLADGRLFALDVAMYVRVHDDHIERIEEYFDCTAAAKTLVE